MAVQRIVETKKGGNEKSELLNKVPASDKKDEKRLLKSVLTSSEGTEWDEIPTTAIPPMAVEFVGEQSTGKTYSALTFPKPALLDTEGKGWVVAKQLGIKKFKAATCFEDVINFIKEVITDPEIETAVFDSSRDIVDWAERYTLEQLDREVLFSAGGAVMYTHVNQKMDWIVQILRANGKNVVFTSRMKDEYVNDKRTGKLVRDGYKKAPYQMDLVFMLSNVVEWGNEIKITDEVVAQVLKNGYVIKTKKKPYILDTSYKGIVGSVFEPIEDKDAYMKEFMKGL